MSKLGVGHLALFGATALLATFLVGIEPAGAQTSYVVTTTADVVDPSDGLLSFREAMDLANSDNDDSQILLASGQHYELSLCGGAGEANNAHGDLDHNDYLHWLMISGIGEQPTVSTVCSDRHIDHRSIKPLGVSNIRFLNGNADLDPTPAVGNAYPEDVGGGSIESLGVVVSRGSTFIDNKAFVLPTPTPGTTTPAPGGAISANKVIAIDSKFRGNSSDEGGAIGKRFSQVFDPSHFFAEATITNSTFTSNNATGVGGAVAVVLLTVKDSTFSGNRSANGGAVLATAGSIDNSEFRGNRADLNGGDAIVRGLNDADPNPLDPAFDGKFDISNSVFESSSAGFACGSILSIHLALSASTIRGASSGGRGGGICVAQDTATFGWSSPGSLSMVDSIVADNTADSWGGGMNVAGHLSMNRSLVASNTAKYGGGLYHWYLTNSGISTVDILQSQFDRNTAEFSGGGIFLDGNNFGNNQAKIENTTFSNNTAEGTGGGLAVEDGVNLVHNTWFGKAPTWQTGTAIADLSTTGTVRLRANAISGGGIDCNLAAPPLSQSYNTDSDNSCGLAASTGDLPGFTTLVGSTPFVVQGVSVGTTAQNVLANWIPAASCTLPVDQIGVLRPLGTGCTPGAREVGPAGPVGPNDPTEFNSDETAGDARAPIGGAASASEPSSSIPDASNEPTDMLKMAEIAPALNIPWGLGLAHSAVEWPEDFFSLMAPALRWDAEVSAPS